MCTNNSGLTWVWGLGHLETSQTIILRWWLTLRNDDFFSGMTTWFLRLPSGCWFFLTAEPLTMRKLEVDNDLLSDIKQLTKGLDMLPNSLMPDSIKMELNWENDLTMNSRLSHNDSLKCKRIPTYDMQLIACCKIWLISIKEHVYAQNILLRQCYHFVLIHAIVFSPQNSKLMEQWRECGTQSFAVMSTSCWHQINAKKYK